MKQLKFIANVICLAGGVLTQAAKLISEVQKYRK